MDLIGDAAAFVALVRLHDGVETRLRILGLEQLRVAAAGRDRLGNVGDEQHVGGVGAPATARRCRCASRRQPRRPRRGFAPRRASRCAVGAGRKRLVVDRRVTVASLRIVLANAAARRAEAQPSADLNNSESCASRRTMTRHAACDVSGKAGQRPVSGQGAGADDTALVPVASAPSQARSRICGHTRRRGFPRASHRHRSAGAADPRPPPRRTEEAVAAYDALGQWPTEPADAVAIRCNMSFPMQRNR